MADLQSGCVESVLDPDRVPDLVPDGAPVGWKMKSWKTSCLFLVAVVDVDVVVVVLICWRCGWAN